MPQLYFDSDFVKPLDHSVGRPEFVFAGAHVPLVPTCYRKASKLRVLVQTPDGLHSYALYNGTVPDISRIINTIEQLPDGSLAFKRVDGSAALVLPIAGEVIP